MRIAQIAPLYEAVPPKLYGGTERVVSWLADALVDLGHDVSLFAAADARTTARLIPVRDQAIRLDRHPLKSDLAAHLSMLHEVARRVEDFDILHFHVDLLHFPMFERIAERTVTTLHGRLDLKDLNRVYSLWPDFPLVSISQSQRKDLPRANWAATVQHGLPSDLLTPAFAGDHRRDYLAFLGRISPEKRPDRAIEIAKRTGIKLRIAAKVDVVDDRYFHEIVAPLMRDAPVEFIGEISDAEKRAFLSGAIAALFPVDWPEPFGLVMIEAMACGTPVIAWPCGSVPEVVDDGVTGILVDTLDDAVAAVHRAHTLNRTRIRHVFERRFSADVMARNYLHLYARLHGKARGSETVLKTA